jgi:hypothetical protein
MPADATGAYATPGSLSRHFLRKHARKLEEKEEISCLICNVKLEHRQYYRITQRNFRGLSHGVMGTISTTQPTV